MAQRARTRAKPKSNAPLYGVVLALVILGGGAWVATVGARAREAAEARVAEVARKSAGPKPFAEMEPERPAFEQRGKPGKVIAKAPADLVKEPIWTEAVALGELGDSAYRYTIAAKRKGDRTEQNERGNEAKQHYNEALEKTAAWEEELIARYGDGEPTVREITRTRSRWFEALDWLLKNTSR